MEETEMTSNKIAKINKDRKHLMNLLRKLRIEIIALLQDKNCDRRILDELFRRRKDYRNRLTKLTKKKGNLK